MIVEGKHYRSIWIDFESEEIVKIIDQRKLPFVFEVESISTHKQMAVAIQEMHLRGAGLIGAAGAYGMYLAALESLQNKDTKLYLQNAAETLKMTRPTAVNLSWAVDHMLNFLSSLNDEEDLILNARHYADSIANQDANACRMIGEHGLYLIRKISKMKKKKTVNILTHCNAGWLAFVDFGSALAPIYAAFDQGIDVHVWVDETRPRNQGARLTAWELGQHGVKHTVIADNTGGHLMQNGLVDLVIVGADRCSLNGDIANKIGTYLKALAAQDNQIPFYVALPSSTIDWNLNDGLKEIPIEERTPDEVKTIDGLYQNELITIQLTPKNSHAINYGFDVTPARLISGLITERGICQASKESILNLFPEHG